MWNVDAIVAGYAQGYFLMHDDDTERVQWYTTPGERALIPLDRRFRYPRSLQRTLNRQLFVCRIDSAFAAVVRGCAARAETWISPELASIYLALHQAGWAHSFEVWQGNRLAGGLLGLTLGGVFVGESMFHAVPNASKVGLVMLVRHLQQQRFSLLDAQIMNAHLKRFGAFSIPQADYLQALAVALKQPRSLHEPTLFVEPSSGATEKKSAIETGETETNDRSMHQPCVRSTASCIGEPTNEGDSPDD
ncbi:MAG: leucyl/phenylalanyl-tRNA--protein transferase [Cyanobacteria bacterium P01_D01_bin.123]